MLIINFLHPFCALEVFTETLFCNDKLFFQKTYPSKEKIGQVKAYVILGDLYNEYGTLMSLE